MVHSALGVLLLAVLAGAMKMFPNMSIIFSLESVLVTSTTHQTTAGHHVIPTGQFYIVFKSLVEVNQAFIVIVKHQSEVSTLLLD